MKLTKHLVFIGLTSLSLSACLTNNDNNETSSISSELIQSSQSISSDTSISFTPSSSEITLSSSSKKPGDSIIISSSTESSSEELQSSSSFQYTDSVVPYKVISSNQPALKRVVGYLPIYKGLNAFENKLNLDVITHLDLAFVNPDGKNGSFNNFSKSQTWVQFLPHQQKYVDKGIKIIASIGGAAANSTMYKHLMLSENRTAFIDSLMQFTLRHNLDGIDVDLEGSLVTNVNYNPFVLELADSLKAHNLIITAAVAQYTGRGISDETIAKFDFLNLMAYDQRGTWTPNDVGPHSHMNFVKQNISYWENDRGVSKDKIVVGVPFYGYKWSLLTYEISGEVVADKSVDYVSWRSFVTNHPDRANADFGGQKNTIDGIWYGDGKNTMRDKTLLSREYGGIMIWEIEQDTQDDTSLMQVIIEHSGK